MGSVETNWKIKIDDIRGGRAFKNLPKPGVKHARSVTKRAWLVRDFRFQPDRSLSADPIPGSRVTLRLMVGLNDRFDILTPCGQSAERRLFLQLALEDALLCD